MTTTVTALPTGTWHVDAGASQANFSSRAMFGLVGVKGTFATSEGEMVVSDAGAHGELRIQAASLDTKNKKRDEHLRSADFFDVVNSPTVRFTLADVSPAADGSLIINGTLQIRNNKLQITAPVTATEISADRLRLHTTISVDRTQAGVGWSKMGMVQGKAHLDVNVELIRDSA
jgi:polyisoprenoid-binding protein YceI